jgi:hypothetical protein
LDLELESAWRERRWGAFLGAWIMSIALAAAVGFVAPLVMVGVYILISLLFSLDNRFAADIWSVCLWIASLAGMFTLLFTLPIMALKSSQGDLAHKPSGRDA